MEEKDEKTEKKEKMTMVRFKKDSPSVVYVRMPRFLLEMKLSPMAMVLYALLMDRAELSRRNGWVEEDGSVYQNFTEESLAVLLRRSRAQIQNLKRQLERANLLETRRQGLGLPSRLYLKIPLDGNSKNYTYEAQKTDHLRPKKLITNKNNIIRTYNKKEDTQNIEDIQDPDTFFESDNW